MKTIFIMLVAIGMAFAGSAQEQVSATMDEVTIVPAQFVGVDYNVSSVQETDLLKQYLRENIEYPPEAVKNMKQGIEVAKFSVSETGEVGDIEIINSVSRDIDEEFIAALKSTSGKWKPAASDGHNRACYKEVSLTFSLMENNAKTQEYFLDKATKHYLSGSEAMLLDHKIKKAEKSFDRAMNYLPNDGNLLYLRGICRYENGNIEGAKSDWTRYSEITGFETPPTELALDENEFKGVEAFAEVVKKH